MKTRNLASKPPVKAFAGIALVFLLTAGAAGQDYPGYPSYEVEQKFLPKGIVMIDWIRIDYMH